MGAKQFLLLKGQEPLLSLQLVSSKEIHWVLFSSALQCIKSLRSLARSVVPLTYMDGIYLVSSNVESASPEG